MAPGTQYFAAATGVKVAQFRGLAVVLATLVGGGPVGSGAF